ncbi:MAG: 50S ribosomal protein L6 [Pseudomonadota bacterium]|nr:50S ribosomal protein L6 [Pseudomonadota bacterium]MDE3037870.1 50S ribosomal protein L6 [Pseudomonadota bacterium]
MSRVGKAAVAIPSGVTVNVNGRDVAVKGGKGELKLRLAPEVSVEVKDGKAWVKPAGKSARSRAMWGTSQRQLKNLVEGVSTGFTTKLDIQGVGFRASADKQYLTISLGFSHEIKYAIPAGIEIKCVKPTEITITGASRALVGQVAAEIRELRKPEPYKGKGVRREGEYVRRKEGKKK